MIDGEKFTLDDVGQWGSGGTPFRSKPEYYGGDIPWLIIEDLNDGVVSSAKERITFEGLKNSSAKLLGPGTLLIAMYGSIGKLGITNIQCATNQAIAFCKVNPEVADTKFLFYYLMYIRPQLIGEGRGGTQQNISQTILKEVPITLPSVPQQRAIAQRLERADRLRRLRQHALTIGDQYLQNVFLEMFGDPETNPKGWEREELGELMAVPPQIGTTQPAGSIGKQRCVRVGEIGSYYVDLEACGFVNLDEKNLRKYRLAHEDLLLARAIGSLDHLGKMSIVHDTRDDLVYDSHVMRLRLDSSRLLPRFLMTMLVTPGGRSLFLKQARRTAVQFNVNADQMKALPVLVPKLSEQKRFVAVVQKHERLRRMQVEALRQAEQLYETLLEEAFGEQPLGNL